MCVCVCEHTLSFYSLKGLLTHLSLPLFAQDCEAFRLGDVKSFYVGKVTEHLVEIKTEKKTETLITENPGSDHLTQHQHLHDLVHRQRLVKEMLLFTPLFLL